MIHNHTSTTSPHRNITFTLPPHPDEEVQDETQNITPIRDTSVNVLSLTRTISKNTRNIFRSIYDPPPLPSAFKHSNKTIQPENNRNNNQQTSSQTYDPINYSFCHHLVQIIKQATIKMFPNLTIILI